MCHVKALVRGASREGSKNELLCSLVSNLACAAPHFVLEVLVKINFRFLEFIPNLLTR